MPNWWDMTIEELAREAEDGLRTPVIRPDVVQGVLELLDAKVKIATAESQATLARRLLVATWVLAGATIALVLATMALVVVTLSQ